MRHISCLLRCSPEEVISSTKLLTHSLSSTKNMCIDQIGKNVVPFLVEVCADCNWTEVTKFIRCHFVHVGCRVFVGAFEMFYLWC